MSFEPQHGWAALLTPGPLASPSGPATARSVPASVFGTGTQSDNLARGRTVQVPKASDQNNNLKKTCSGGQFSIPEAMAVTLNWVFL